MNEETIKNIIQKYKAGETSLEEEKRLFDSAEKMEQPLRIWSSFVNQNQKEIPENLNEKLWESFDKRTKNTNKLRLRILSVAASIALIFTLFIYNSRQNKLTVKEKQALLEEAKNMFIKAEQEQVMYQKILENELVVVYTKVQ